MTADEQTKLLEAADEALRKAERFLPNMLRDLNERLPRKDEEDE